MQHNAPQYELKFGETKVSVRRRGSAYVKSAEVLGLEHIDDGRVRIWLDRLVFDEPTVEQDGWQAYGAISTILEAPSNLLAQEEGDRQ